GPWIPDFEHLAGYVAREIPREDTILLLPDADLFYYTTGREPQVRVLAFDTTTNAYASEEVLKLSGDPRVRWLIVKHESQLDDADVNSSLQNLSKLLRPEFTPVKKLRNYDVHRRL